MKLTDFVLNNVLKGQPNMLVPSSLSLSLLSAPPPPRVAPIFAAARERWENDEKMMRKWWENDAKMMRKWWENDANKTRKWCENEEKTMKKWSDPTFRCAAEERFLHCVALVVASECCSSRWSLLMRNSSLSYHHYHVITSSCHHYRVIIIILSDNSPTLSSPNKADDTESVFFDCSSI